MKQTLTSLGDISRPGHANSLELILYLYACSKEIFANIIRMVKAPRAPLLQNCTYIVNRTSVVTNITLVLHGGRNFHICTHYNACKYT